jgi:hypothetical protein
MSMHTPMLKHHMSLKHPLSSQPPKLHATLSARVTTTFSAFKVAEVTISFKSHQQERTEDVVISGQLHRNKAQTYFSIEFLVVRLY